MKTHHRARRLALQAMCCLDAQGEKGWPLVRQFILDSKEERAALDDALRLAESAWQHRPECDRLLARHARHWDLGRLALVDRNILRLAVQELRQAAAPPRVVISEALRLAEEFSTAESARFVNGVLDAVRRELAGEGRDGETEKGETSRDVGGEGDGSGRAEEKGD